MPGFMVPAADGPLAIEIKVAYQVAADVDLDHAQRLLTQAYATAFAELTARLEKKT